MYVCIPRWAFLQVKMSSSLSEERGAHWQVRYQYYHIYGGLIIIKGSKVGPTIHTMPCTGDALLLADGSYIPEFTAFVASENIRLLQLKRADYFADGGRGTGHINFSDIQS
jgi:hypothetical protein